MIYKTYYYCFFGNLGVSGEVVEIVVVIVVVIVVNELLLSSSIFNMFLTFCKSSSFLKGLLKISFIPTFVILS